MEQYFKKIEEDVRKAYSVAEEARKKGHDPVENVEVPLARNMAERVEGLISVAAPQIKGSGIVERIMELEKDFGILDWRVALTLALEVAQQKFCKFEDKREAMEIGLRIGMAYLTVGVVASPLEGFVKLELKKRKDGKKYFCLYFSGPIRSAGGTATTVFIALADYVRKEMGYSEYDPTKDEIKRSSTEINDFHERITNLQYLPSVEEIEFIVGKLPVQIDGDASEKIEVSNYKGLQRIEANRLRNGFCLVIAEGITQKAKKFWGKFNKWHKDFGMKHWEFMGDFVKLQERIRAKAKKGSDENEKISPDFTFIKDLVAGRPVLTHPLRIGGFRLRYGRCRNSGFSSNAIHPATMVVLNDFIAIGTQLKVERPGKATTIALCDTIEGPIVKLNNGSVVILSTRKEAEEVVKDVEEIIFLGDILINYGDFLDRGHKLVPCGYNEDWYKVEIKSKSGMEIDINKIGFEDSLKISKDLQIPLHPRFTYHWKDIDKEQLKSLLEWFRKIVVEDDKVILPFVYDIEKDVEGKDAKRVLELLGVPHQIVKGEHVVIENDFGKAIIHSLGLKENNVEDILVKLSEFEGDVLQFVNSICSFEVRDKSGTFIGARMGRPEKAKMRKLTGSPQVLFPVGDEGGRLRCFQSALEKGNITGDFPIYYCDKCKNEGIYSVCIKCGLKGKRMYYCRGCKKDVFEDKCEQHGKNVPYKKQRINIHDYYAYALKNSGIKEKPELVKGVRGTSNEDHTPENLMKGLLRAKNKIYVNKEGTVRYDMTETTLTAFKPKEIGTSIKKLKDLGYNKDIDGKELINEEQIVELKVQDVVLPSNEGCDEEGADKILFRVGNFIDDLLENLYGVKRFYNFKSEKDLVGQLIVAMSPHTSAGAAGRIIGFSKTQGFYAHPMLHCLMRRDCVTGDTFINFYNSQKGCWEIVKIGDYVDSLKDMKKADLLGTLTKKVEGISSISYGENISSFGINNFTKHKPSKILKVKTELGNSIKTTLDHKFYTFDKGKFRETSANNLKRNDKLVVPYKFDIPEKDIKSFDLVDIFKKREDVVLRNIGKWFKKFVDDEGGKKNFGLKFKLKKHDLDNFLLRDSYPIKLIFKLLSFHNLSRSDIPKEVKIAIKRDNVSLNPIIPVNSDVLYLFGLYIAEGYSRKNDSKKGFYQVSIAATENYIREKIVNIMGRYFSLKPSNIHEHNFVYSSKLIYEFFNNYLKLGKGAYEKRIPSVFLDLKKEKLSYLLKGYFDGDGSVSLSDLRVTCDTVSEGLIRDLNFVFNRYGIFLKEYEYSKIPGPVVRDFYLRKGREVPIFKVNKIIILSDFCKKFSEEIGFRLPRKKEILDALLKKKKSLGTKIKYDQNFIYPKVVSIEKEEEEQTYCLQSDSGKFLGNGFLINNCDGDEACVILLMDVLLNFSRKYLPAHRGAVQDAPLVLTYKLIPTEVDDMVFNMDIVREYPLELYEAAMEYKYPWDIKIKTVNDILETEGVYSGYFFTHDVSDLNDGVKVSAYKSIPTMQEKVQGQMEIAEKLRAVDEMDVARLVLERHFIRDIKGNLRKFSIQQYRCVDCNGKYRRPPLMGRCKCGGKIIFTIAEGSVVKYLEPSLQIAEKYSLPAYLRQTLELTKDRIEGVFGKEKDKQEGLVKWF